MINLDRAMHYPFVSHTASDGSFTLGIEQLIANVVLLRLSPFVVKAHP